MPNMWIFFVFRIKDIITMIVAEMTKNSGLGILDRKSVV
jgi:hypothetical protein